MQTSLPDTFSRILAIRLDNIGDVVMTGPALRALRQAYPRARITLMASPGGGQAAPLLPWVDDVITWRAVWQDIAKNPPVAPKKEYELADLLAGHEFDAAFIFTSFSQSPYPPAYACYLAGIPLRVGQSREFGGALLSHWVRPPRDETYQVERNLHLLRSVGIPIRSAAMELTVPETAQQSASALLAAAGICLDQPYLVLAPGASAAARRYDEARFADVALRLVGETGLPVVLIGSPREAGAFPALEVLASRQSADASLPANAKRPEVVSLIGKTSLPEMAAIIGGSALLIGNNSGSMHIAAALRRPMVILFSGTDLLEQWAPRTGRANLLNRPTGCAPCRGFQCPYHMECLDIPPGEVVTAALGLLKTAEPAELAEPARLDLSPPPAPTNPIEDTIRR